MTIAGIGLIGRKRSGKTTVAEHLTDGWGRWGFAQASFADPLRALARIINPVISPNGERLNDAELLYGYERAKDLFPMYRGFLQDLGDGTRRVVGENTWVNVMHRTLDYHQTRFVPPVPVVVPDVRYENEAQALRDRHFALVRVVRPGIDTSDSHVSETELDDFPVDAVLRNDHSDVASLTGAIDLMMTDLLAHDPLPR